MHTKQYFTFNEETFFLRFSNNSEADASELLENSEINVFSVLHAEQCL